MRSFWSYKRGHGANGYGEGFEHESVTSPFTGEPMLEALERARERARQEASGEAETLRRKTTDGLRQAVR
jgi:hypothetical protein